MSEPVHTIVCLSSQPWADGMWTNKQHIMSRLGRRHRVLHLNFGATPLWPLARRKMRQSLTAALRPLSLLIDPIERQQDGVTTLDFYEPVLGVRKLPRHHPVSIAATYDLRRRLLARYLRRQGINDAIVWVYHPGYGPAVAELPHKLLAYDCVDEYAAFPEYSAQPDWLIARERALCERADVVFTTSQGLFEVKRDFNPDNTYLVHNVGDSAHFAKAMDSSTVVPDDIAKLPKPVIGYVGAVSDYKLNIAWLLQLAAQRRDWSFALIGPVGVGDPSTDIGRLRLEPNVHLLGHRDYAQLPGYLKGFDVAVIPHRINNYTHFSFPIKFFEFLASGKPVVISALPAVERYFDAVMVAEDCAEMITHCEQALANPLAGRERRVALAQQNSWDARVARLMEQIERRLEK